MRPFGLMSAARSASSSSVIIGKRSATGCTGRLLISTVVLIVAPTDSLRGSDWQASSVQCRFSYRQRRQSATAHRRALEDGVSFAGRADGPHDYSRVSLRCLSWRHLLTSRRVFLGLMHHGEPVEFPAP